jgi:hypothetical protein
MLDVKIGPARGPAAGPRTTSTSWSPCAKTSSSRATFWCCRRLAHSICARARGPVSGSAHRRRPHLVLGPLGGRPERAGQPGGDPKPPSLGWWQLTVCAGARWRCPKARTPQHGRAARSFCSGLGQRPTSRCARWATLCDSAATSAPPCARSTCTRAPQRLRLPPRARQAQGLPSHHCRQHRRCMRAAA